MKQLIRNNKAMIFLVVVLLITNIALVLYFLVFKKPTGFQGNRPGNFSLVDHMKKEVGFNEQQSEQFKLLLEQNRDSMKVLSEGVKIAKTSLYKLLQQPNSPDSLITAAGKTLGEQQQAMELQMFRHLQRVRALCNTEQLAKFDTMVTKMSNRSPWGRRNGGPKQEEPIKK